MSDHRVGEGVLHVYHHDSGTVGVWYQDQDDVAQSTSEKTTARFGMTLDPETAEAVGHDIASAPVREGGDGITLTLSRDVAEALYDSCEYTDVISQFPSVEPALFQLGLALGKIEGDPDAAV